MFTLRVAPSKRTVTALNAGDALMATEIDRLTLRDGRDAEVLVFDLRGQLTEQGRGQ